MEEMIVCGNSLDPLIKPEQTIKALFGYYDCHEIKKGEIVLFVKNSEGKPYLVSGNAYKQYNFWSGRQKRYYSKS